MGKIAGIVFIILICSFTLSCPQAPKERFPFSDEGWELLWSDEFEGDSLDKSKWNVETGTGSQYVVNGVIIYGWGNDEQQYYREENITVRDGKLILEAKKEYFGGMNYTSAKVSTGAIKQGPMEGGNTFPIKYEVKMGKVEIRAKSSRGEGFWPALWMIGADSNEFGPYPVQGWPRCGEMDIMEIKGGMENRYYSTIHYGELFPAAYWSYGNYINLTHNLADDFNVYAIVWDENTMRFLLNGKLWQTIYFSDLERPRANLKAFTGDIGFAINMNLSVGGNFINKRLPCDSVFLQESPVEDRCLIIDYVRVYGR